MQEEEAGDLLFVCVNVARFLGLDAEITLKKANRKFSRRFREMERQPQLDGRQLAILSAEELEVLWREAKARKRNKAPHRPPARLDSNRRINTQD